MVSAGDAKDKVEIHLSKLLFLPENDPYVLEPLRRDLSENLKIMLSGELPS